MDRKQAADRRDDKEQRQIAKNILAANLNDEFVSAFIDWKRSEETTILRNEYGISSEELNEMAAIVAENFTRRRGVK